MNKIRCRHCRGLFSPRPQVPQQRYCSLPDCQKARKRHWQKHKLKNDADYQDNQRQAQRRWVQRHRDYWHRYRQTHPTYQENNKKAQSQRDRRRRSGTKTLLAKMDVSMSETKLESGTYEVFPVACKDGRVKQQNLFIINQVE